MLPQIGQILAFDETEAPHTRHIVMGSEASRTWRSKKSLTSET